MLAVVLGGGGLTGHAWEIGLIKGLHDQGIDLNEADLVVGTSAGAVAGTQLRSGQSIDVLYSALVSPPASAPLLAGNRASPLPNWAGWKAQPDRGYIGIQALAAANVQPEAAHTRAEAQQARAVDWPSGDLELIAVATDGTIRAFDRSQGVPLITAIAASTAIPGVSAPIAVGSERYMDGGVAGTNVDQATGFQTVLAITPFPLPSTNGEMNAVTAAGGRVLDIAADAPTRAALASDARDASALSRAALAGFEKAVAVGPQVRAFLDGTMVQPDPQRGA